VLRLVWALGLVLVSVARPVSPVVWVWVARRVLALGSACVVAWVLAVRRVLAPALAYAAEPVLETVPVWEAALR